MSTRDPATCATWPRLRPDGRRRGERFSLRRLDLPNVRDAFTTGAWITRMLLDNFDQAHATAARVAERALRFQS